MDVTAITVLEVARFLKYHLLVLRANAITKVPGLVVAMSSHVGIQILPNASLQIQAMERVLKVVVIARDTVIMVPVTAITVLEVARFLKYHLLVLRANAITKVPGLVVAMSSHVGIQILHNASLHLRTFKHATKVVVTVKGILE